MKISYKQVLELENIHFKYERLEALISLMQTTVNDTAEIMGLPENCLEYSLCEVGMNLSDNNSRLKEILRGISTKDATQKGA